MFESPQHLSELQSYLKSFDIAITDEQASLCLKHLDLVVEKNKVLNLTRIVDEQDAIVLHLVDSLLLLPYLAAAPQGPLLDMGSGGGFPAIELAVCSQRPVVMIDSVGKKVSAINEFVDGLELKDTLAVHKRLEDVSSDERHSYACVTARALASLPVLLEYAEPYVIQNGLLVLTKGNPTDEELNSGMSVAKMFGFTLIQESSFELPLNLGHRELLVFKKMKRSTIKLPRQIGAAKKNPLA